LALTRPLNSQLISEFTVPYKGTWRSLAVQQISPDALFDSLNVYLRDGKLKERPALALLNTFIFPSSIIGGAMAVTPNDKILLAIGQSTLHTLKLTDTLWQLDTTATFATNSDSTVDTTFLENSTDYFAVFANQDNILKSWTETGGAITIVDINANPVPKATSVCTTARRIVALTPPHTINWTLTNTIDNWENLAENRIAQTNDIAICIRSLGTLNFVVYKERSIYIGQAQAGSNANAFRINFVQHVEGPASVHSVVSAPLGSKNSHFYMTTNGRIGVFSGTAYVQWIADGLWLFLQDDIDRQFTSKIFGIFHYRLHIVIFYYPRIGDNGEVKGMVIINLPLEGSGVTTPAAFLGLSSRSVSYGFESRFTNQIDNTVLFTADTLKSFTLDEDTDNDDGLTFDCSLQTGIMPTPELGLYQVALEVFLERSDGNGQANLSLVSSHNLSNATGDLDPANFKTLDLNFEPSGEYEGFNTRLRWSGIKLDWVSDSDVRYSGGVIYGQRLSA